MGAALDCGRSCRQSADHWGAVRSRRSQFAFDISQLRRTNAEVRESLSSSRLLLAEWIEAGRQQLRSEQLQAIANRPFGQAHVSSGLTDIALAIDDEPTERPTFLAIDELKNVVRRRGSAQQFDSSILRIIELGWKSHLFVVRRLARFSTLFEPAGLTAFATCALEDYPLYDGVDVRLSDIGPLDRLLELDRLKRNESVVVRMDLANLDNGQACRNNSSEALESEQSFAILE